MKCQYCKNDYPKNDFRIKGTGRYSPYCTACKDTAEIKEKEQSTGNFARAFNTKEINFMKEFIKSIPAKERAAKFPLSGGKVEQLPR